MKKLTFEDETSGKEAGTKLFGILSHASFLIATRLDFGSQTYTHLSLLKTDDKSWQLNQP